MISFSNGKENISVIGRSRWEKMEKTISRKTI
jgi:hypothetical protein